MSKIGVFDSGLGGLTVLKQLHKHFPNQEYIYFGDNARVPYGSKSEKMVNHYSEQAVNFLIAKGAEFIVIACNTSSAIALEYLKQKFPKIGFVGMIEPAVKGALSVSESQKIGVIGTQATIASEAYQNELKNHPVNSVITKSCPLFVPFVESGMTKHKALDLIIEDYLEEFHGKIDTLILACTHYPYLRESIQNFLPKINIIDTGEQTAIQLKSSFIASNKSETEFYVSDKPNTFIEVARDNLGLEITGITQIDIESY